MESITSKTKTADDMIQRKQEDTVKFQGKMQIGKSVEKKETDVALLIKMTVKSNINRATINDAAEVKDTQEVASGTSLIIPEVRVYQGIAPTVFLRGLVSRKIKILNNRTGELVKENALPQCLLVVEFFEKMESEQNLYDSNEYDYLIFKISPYYEDSLGLALQYLQTKADIGCSCEYRNELNTLAKYFYLQSIESPTKLENREKITTLIKSFIENELNYLIHLKNSNNLDSINHASYVFHMLLSSEFFSGFIDERYIKDVMRKRKKIRDESDSVSYNFDENEETEKLKLATLEETLASSAVCMNLQRDYRDVLRKQLFRLKNKHKADKASIDDTTIFLASLSDIYRKSITLIPEFHTLSRDLGKIIVAVLKKLLISIKNGVNMVDKLKVDVINIAANLYKQGALTEDCKQLYDCIIRQQAEPINIDEDEKCTFTYYDNYINDLFYLMKGFDDNRYQKAAINLKNLLDEKADEIIKMDMLDMLIRKIDGIKSKLYKYFFMEIFRSFNIIKNSRMNHHEQVSLMAGYKRKLIEAAPYTYLLRNVSCKNSWKKIACIIISRDIDCMLINQLPSDEDINTLLLLKKIAPDVPNWFVMVKLENVLIKHFRIYLAHYFNEKHVKIIMEFSKWIDYLNSLGLIKPSLIQLQKKWERKTITTSENTFKDKPIAPRFSDEPKQCASAGIGTIVEHKPQSTSSYQVFRRPPCNFEHTPQEITLPNARMPIIGCNTSSRLPMYMRMPSSTAIGSIPADCINASPEESQAHGRRSVPARYPSVLMNPSSSAIRQSSISTAQQSLQAPDYARIVPSTDDDHQFSKPPAMMPQHSLHGAYQATPTPEFVQQKKSALLPFQSFQPIVHPPSSPMEYNETHSLRWGIQQIAIRSFESMKANQLESAEDGATSMPTQHKKSWLNPEAPCYYPTTK